MAPRRLVIVITTLIAASILINVVAQPLREQRSRMAADTTQQTSTATDPTTTGSDVTGSADKEAETVDSTPPAAAGTGRETRVGERLITIPPGGRVSARVRVGTPLTLVVKSARSAEISIPDLGLSAFADRYAPARFSILPRQSGRLMIRSSHGGSRGLIIVVGPRVPESR